MANSEGEINSRVAEAAFDGHEDGAGQDEEAGKGERNGSHDHPGEHQLVVIFQDASQKQTCKDALDNGKGDNHSTKDFHKVLLEVRLPHDQSVVGFGDSFIVVESRRLSPDSVG